MNKICLAILQLSFAPWILLRELKEEEAQCFLHHSLEVEDEYSKGLAALQISPALQTW